MRRDAEGNRIFEGPGEAVWAQREFSLRLVRWLHEISERTGAELPSFPYYRSLINTWSQVTARWILAREDRINYLQDKVRDLTDEVDSLRAQIARRTADLSSP